MDLLLGKDSGGSGSAVGYCPSKICLFCQFIHKTWVIWRRKGKDLLDLLTYFGWCHRTAIAPHRVQSCICVHNSDVFRTCVLLPRCQCSSIHTHITSRFSVSMFRFSADELWCHFLTPTAVALLQWPYCSGPTAVAGRGSLLDFIAQFWQLSMKLSMFCWTFETVLNIRV